MISHIPNTKSLLGEGPVYHQQSLYWTDIKARQVCSLNLNTNQINRSQFTKPIGSLAFTTEQTIIAATSDGFEILDLTTNKTSPLLNPETNLPNNRFNDGKCDANGRYFAGTMDNNEQEITGSLYCYDGQTATKKISDLFISNGLGWNNNSTKFYLTDSPKQVIYQFDYCLATAKLSNQEIFAQITNEADGFPDGLCIDSQDYIWSAHWDGGKITRYAPNGNIDLILEIPAPRVTSCCFGGKNLATLFITTAAFGLTKSQLKSYPLSGYIFQYQSAVCGQGTNLFKTQ